MSVAGFVVSGCGTEKLNGNYWPDSEAKQKMGMSRPFRQEDGDGTIEYRSSGSWYEPP